MKAPRTLEEAFLFHESHKEEVGNIILIAEETLEKIERRFEIQAIEPPAEDLELWTEELNQESPRSKTPAESGSDSSPSPSWGSGPGVVQWLANILAFNLSRLKHHSRILEQRDSSNNALCQGMVKAIHEERKERKAVEAALGRFQGATCPKEKKEAENELRKLVESCEKREKLMSFFGEELEERGEGIFPSLCWFHVSLNMTCELASCAQEILRLPREKFQGKSLDKMVGRIMSLVNVA